MEKETVPSPSTACIQYVHAHCGEIAMDLLCAVEPAGGSVVPPFCAAQTPRSEDCTAFHNATVELILKIVLSVEQPLSHHLKCSGRI